MGRAVKRTELIQEPGSELEVGDDLEKVHNFSAELQELLFVRFPGMAWPVVEANATGLSRTAWKPPLRAPHCSLKQPCFQRTEGVDGWSCS